MSSRVWDEFLTPQDRAHVATAPLAVRHGVGRVPALLMIDLYRWVYGIQPLPLLESVESWPGSCGLAAWEAIAPTQRLLEVARSAGIPIIHTTVLREEFPRPLRRLSRHGSAVSDRAHRWPEAFEIIDEFRPAHGEPVIRKLSASAFTGTPLDTTLRLWGCDSLIVAGETTSGCVRASVVDGWAAGFPVTVVEECVFDRHEASHALSLFDMDQKYATVDSLDDVVSAVESLRGG